MPVEEAAIIWVSCAFVMPLVVRRVSHVTDPGKVRMQSRHQRGTCRAATGSVVELRKSHAAPRQCIDMRSINLSTIGTNIRKPHIIDEDDDDIRFFSREKVMTLTDQGEQQQSSNERIPDQCAILILTASQRTSEDIIHLISFASNLCG